MRNMRQVGSVGLVKVAVGSVDVGRSKVTEVRAYVRWCAMWRVDLDEQGSRRQSAWYVYPHWAPALKPHDIPRFDASGRASARRVGEVAAMTSFLVLVARALLLNWSRISKIVYMPTYHGK